MSSSRKYKVVLDTNIFISGILFGGNAEKILHLYGQDRIELVISPETINELLTKLEKFKVSPQILEDTFYALDKKATKVLPRKKIYRSRDPKDNMFLAVAGEAKADFLITGDKDLLILKKFEGTLIISPAEFLKIVEKK